MFDLIIECELRLRNGRTVWPRHHGIEFFALRYGFLVERLFGALGEDTSFFEIVVVIVVVSGTGAEWVDVNGLLNKARLIDVKPGDAGECVVKVQQSLFQPLERCLQSFEILDGIR